MSRAAGGCDFTIVRNLLLKIAGQDLPQVTENSLVVGCMLLALAKLLLIAISFHTSRADCVAPYRSGSNIVPECAKTAVCPTDSICDSSAGYCAFFNASFLYGCIATPVNSNGIQSGDLLCSGPPNGWSPFPDVGVKCCCYQNTCPPGKYGGSLSVCRVCDKGTFSSMSGINKGHHCPSGTFSDVGATACQTCPAGKFAPPLSYSRNVQYGYVSIPNVGSNCRNCTSHLAFPSKQCLPGSSSDTTTGCTCPMGYFISNSTDPYNISCISCRSCRSTSDYVFLNPCPGWTQVDTSFIIQQKVAHVIMG